MGHIDSRVANVNSGIPDSLEQTFKVWAGLILDEILPRIDLERTIVLIHPDHGTRRNKLALADAVHHGWLWMKHPQINPGAVHDRSVDWSDYRRTILDILSLQHLGSNNTGSSLIETPPDLVGLDLRLRDLAFDALDFSLPTINLRKRRVA